MSELIKHFGIDWRLLLAQAVNFFILLFLLKRFAYGPIMRILKKRKEEIEKGLKFTKEAEERMVQVGQEREQILSKSRGEAFSIVSQAEEIAKKRKEEIAGEARKRAESVVEEAKRIIGEEKAKMSESVHADAKDLVRLGIEKVLGKMPAGARDGGLIEEAMKELKSIKQ